MSILSQLTPAFDAQVSLSSRPAAGRRASASASSTSSTRPDKCRNPSSSSTASRSSSASNSSRMSASARSKRSLPASRSAPHDLSSYQTQDEDSTCLGSLSLASSAKARLDASWTFDGASPACSPVSDTAGASYTSAASAMALALRESGNGSHSLRSSTSSSSSFISACGSGSGGGSGSGSSGALSPWSGSAVSSPNLEQEEARLAPPAPWELQSSPDDIGGRVSRRGANGQDLAMRAVGALTGGNQVGLGISSSQERVLVELSQQESDILSTEAGPSMLNAIPQQVTHRNIEEQSFGVDDVHSGLALLPSASLSSSSSSSYPHDLAAPSNLVPLGQRPGQIQGQGRARRVPLAEIPLWYADVRGEVLRRLKQERSGLSASSSLSTPADRGVNSPYSNMPSMTTMHNMPFASEPVPYINLPQYSESSSMATEAGGEQLSPISETFATSAGQRRTLFVLADEGMRSTRSLGTIREKDGYASSPLAQVTMAATSPEGKVHNRSSTTQESDDPASTPRRRVRQEDGAAPRSPAAFSTRNRARSRTTTSGSRGR